MRLCLTVAVALLVTSGTLLSVAQDGATGSDRPSGFDQPKLILDGAEYGRMSPAFADIDGDGKIDLVVGVTDWQSRPGGRLLVFRNQGTKTRPQFAKPKWFDETVPTGRIPDG